MSKITREIAADIVREATKAKFEERIEVTAYSLFKSIKANEAAAMCAESSKLFTKKQLGTGLVRMLEEVRLQIALPDAPRYGSSIVSGDSNGKPPIPNIDLYRDYITVHGTYGMPRPLIKSDAAIVPKGETKALIVGLWNTIQERNKFKATLENIVLVGRAIPALIKEYPELAQFVPGKPIPESENVEVKAMLKGLKKVTK